MEELLAKLPRAVFAVSRPRMRFAVCGPLWILSFTPPLRSTVNEVKLPVPSVFAS